MCRKVVTQCCHCGELLLTYFIACNVWRVMARIDTREGRDVARASECEYLTRETRPMLTGCPNNDTCPSWFGNTFWGFGDDDNEGPDIKEARELVAQEKFEEWKADFCRKSFAKKPIPPRKEPDSFLSLILKDHFGDGDTESVMSAQSFEVEDAAPENGGNQDDHEDSYEADNENSTEDGSNETSEIDPEVLLSDDDVEDNPDKAKAQTSGRKLAVQEHEEPVAPFCCSTL
ncbi:hypothetical protein IL306_006958 [Fusarium sp. DS 682]|nr:hypothetical protein IL306_006958 [Fusarium sp. DS 682]